jgi:hypothetical protein
VFHPAGITAGQTAFDDVPVSRMRDPPDVEEEMSFKTDVVQASDAAAAVAMAAHTQGGPVDAVVAVGGAAGTAAVEPSTERAASGLASVASDSLGGPHHLAQAVKSTALTLHWLSPPQHALVVCKLAPAVYPLLNRVLRWLRCVLCV